MSLDADTLDIVAVVAAGDGRQVLIRLSRWAHNQGWTPGPFPGQWLSPDGQTEVAWYAGTSEIGVARKEHNTWMAHDWYPAPSVDEAVRVLVAEGVLPIVFHTAFAAHLANLAGVAS